MMPLPWSRAGARRKPSLQLCPPTAPAFPSHGTTNRHGLGSGDHSLKRAPANRFLSEPEQQAGLSDRSVYCPEVRRVIPLSTANEQSETYSAHTHIYAKKQKEYASHHPPLRSPRETAG